MSSMEIPFCVRRGSTDCKQMPTFNDLSCRCEATYTKILAEKLKERSVDVNACCPGYVDTDMSSHRGTKTVLQGADTPAWLALLAPKGTTGKFFSERNEESL